MYAERFVATTEWNVELQIATWDHSAKCKHDFFPSTGFCELHPSSLDESFQNNGLLLLEVE